MCGITGFLRTGAADADELAATCTRMTDALTHRGPDAGGIWVDANVSLALGHRRLSIIDLSEAGAQPMVSASGRYVASFNGEIYNFMRLRKELSGSRYPYKGHSDTEVLVEAIDCWGLDDTVGRANGMFAFGIWDARERLLHLVRDRIGIKPLYYGRQGNAFLFGSELKALRTHPAFVAGLVELIADAIAGRDRRTLVAEPAGPTCGGDCCILATRPG